MPALRASRPRPTRRVAGIGERPEGGAGEVGEHLERCAGVGDPDEHHAPNLRRPRPPEAGQAASRSGGRRVVARRADDEPAHAVADQGDLADAHGPGGHEAVQEPGELSPVHRDVPAGVVAQAQRRDAVVAGQQGAVGGGRIAGERPHRLGRHQPVHQHGDPAGRARAGRGRGRRDRAGAPGIPSGGSSGWPTVDARSASASPKSPFTTASASSRRPGMGVRRRRSPSAPAGTFPAGTAAGSSSGSSGVGRTIERR